ncbi:unnamed protein product, partial [marine sediment metagenome]
AYETSQKVVAWGGENGQKHRALHGIISKISIFQQTKNFERLLYYE